MKKSRRYRRGGNLIGEEDPSPMNGVGNLFDTAMVFSVALLVALVMSYSLPELLNPSEDLTIVKKSGITGYADYCQGRRKTHRGHEYDR